MRFINQQTSLGGTILYSSPKHQISGKKNFRHTPQKDTQDQWEIFRIQFMEVR